MLKLQKEIQNLELRHKKDTKKEIYQALILKREHLKELLEKEDGKEINRVVREKFRLGNKAGKYLANVLRKKKKRP